MSFSYISGALQYVLKKLPSVKPTAVKRSAVIATSTTVLLALLASAIYFRRKRQKKFPKENALDSVDAKLLRRKRRAKERTYTSSTATSSPSSVKAFKQRRSRNNSQTASVTSSAASSSKSRRHRYMITANSQNIEEVEKLYQEGVDSFESALEKWEKATSILQHTDSHNSTEVDSGARKSLHYEEQQPRSLNNDAALRSDRIRRYSLNTPSSENGENFARSESFSLTHASKKLNNNYYTGSDTRLNDLLNGVKNGTLHKDQPLTPFEEQLQSIVQRAQHLQETFDYVLYDSGTDSDTDITLTGFDEDQVSDADSESNESFVSARETWDTKSVDAHPKRLWMYEQALEAVERGEVNCRTSRCDMLNCFSEDEFLAKLHCVRQGLEAMLQDITVREWLIESGRSMIECILCTAEQSIEEFQQAFASMMEYVNQEENWEEIEDELSGRRVVHMSFYDVVLDFMLMDAFDDLESPPGPVVSIIQNRWLANSLKETALSTAIWSVLKAKRARLQYQDGFVAHLYDISTHVTPALAWGFMGPEGKLKNVCEYFKKEVVDFLKGIFNFDHVRYTTRAQMADDILKITRDRFGSLMQYLRNTSGLANGDLTSL